MRNIDNETKNEYRRIVDCCTYIPSKNITALEGRGIKFHIRPSFMKWDTGNSN